MLLLVAQQAASNKLFTRHDSRNCENRCLCRNRFEHSRLRYRSCYRCCSSRIRLGFCRFRNGLGCSGHILRLLGGTGLLAHTVGRSLDSHNFVGSGLHLGCNRLDTFPFGHRIGLGSLDHVGQNTGPRAVLHSLQSLSDLGRCSLGSRTVPDSQRTYHNIPARSFDSWLDRRRGHNRDSPLDCTANPAIRRVSYQFEGNTRVDALPADEVDNHNFPGMTFAADFYFHQGPVARCIGWNTGCLAEKNLGRAYRLLPSPPLAIDRYIVPVTVCLR